MKNFEVEDKNTGKKYWISRSIAVLALVTVTDEPNGPQYYAVQNEKELKPGDKIYSTDSYSSTDGSYGVTHVVTNTKYTLDKYVLVNKRGSGTPNFQGCWNIPCGYLDYDERLKDACTREVMEEQGVYINPNKWELYLPIDDIVVYGDKKQNVTIRYTCKLTMDEYKEAVKLGESFKKEFNGEKNEVEDRELMPLTQENIESREWAFNHRTLLEYQLIEPIHVD